MEEGRPHGGRFDSKGHAPNAPEGRKEPWLIEVNSNTCMFAQTFVDLQTLSENLLCN
jgi:hypothetical protein